MADQFVMQAQVQTTADYPPQLLEHGGHSYINIRTTGGSSIQLLSAKGFRWTRCVPNDSSATPGVINYWLYAETYDDFRPFRLTDELRGKMIPLQGNYARITGSAIKGSDPFTILFDTGSWTTSFPESAIDPAKRTVVNEGPVNNGWGDDCRLVKGQLAMVSEDGQTTYTVDDFQFYEILEKKADGTPQSGRVIMGAFPSPQHSTKQPSFPYALAQKYSGDHGFGFGFVSEMPSSRASAPPNVGDGWSNMKLYLLLGADPALTRNLRWRSDIPLWASGLDFCPEAVPGFKLRIGVPGTNEEIESPDYLATIDTGAPDLTARLGTTNPHLQPPFNAYFKSDGPAWWAGGAYENEAKSLQDGTVTVIFTDSEGFRRQYSFKAEGWRKSPATLFAGVWDGDVPWIQQQPSFPTNRINLGNTVYYYCPVFFYDIQNKRVGFQFPPGDVVMQAQVPTTADKPVQLLEHGGFSYINIQTTGGSSVQLLPAQGYKWTGHEPNDSSATPGVINYWLHGERTA